VHLIGRGAGNTDQRLFSMAVNTNFPISSASIVDPYIAMITQNGRLLLYKVEYTPILSLRQVSF
jgi:hypothetical protein